MISQSGWLVDPENPFRPRVFGIGLNKTATTSFDEAMNLLGFRCLHWGGPSVRRLVEAALHEGRPLLEDLDPAIDVFSDVEALSLNFELLAEQYPGSRFVLTTRAEDAWVDSRVRHVERNRRLQATGEYNGNFLEIDEPAWRAMWRAHHHAVESFFADRDDLLVVDLTVEPTWDEICGFVGRPIPGAPFPWRNRDSNIAP